MFTRLFFWRGGLKITYRQDARTDLFRKKRDSAQGVIFKSKTQNLTSRPSVSPKVPFWRRLRRDKFSPENGFNIGHAHL